MPTATTAPLLILMAVLWRITNGELLSIVVFFSMFGAASALNIGGSGVSPWIFALLLGGVYKLLKGVPRPRLLSGINITAVRLLAVFVAYSIWTGMVYPFLFRGVPVLSAHGLGQLIPLSWGTANLFQIFYLITVATVFFLALASTRETLDSAVAWYVRACLAVSFFAVYQLANAMFHVPYPSAVLYSNPGYVIYPAYKIDGLWRLSSTHTEASAAASYLSVGVALMGWKVVTTPLRWSSSLSLLFMCGTLLLTQSSTGYLAFIFTLATGGILYVRHLLRGRGLSRKTLLVLVLSAAIGTVLWAFTSAPELLNKEIRSVLLDKKNTASYKDRTESHAQAMQTARQTYFMGAGWGSLRASGLWYQLIGTVGVPGLLLFLAFLGSLTLPVFFCAEGRSRGDLFERSLLATAVSLVGMVVAGAEPVSPVLWTLFAACSAGPYLESRNPRSWRSQSSTGIRRVSALTGPEIAAYQ